LFDADLGYSNLNTGDPIGCWFDMNSQLVPLPNLSLQCILIKSKVVGQGSPAIVEVISFAQVAANSNVIFKLGKIKNPAIV